MDSLMSESFPNPDGSLLIVILGSIDQKHEHSVWIVSKSNCTEAQLIISDTLDDFSSIYGTFL
jgi:hypothetical protein